MPMPWFRFYSSVLDDPKVQRLTGDLFKVWVNLLCLANDADERGTLPERDDIAFRLRLDEQKADDALRGLRRAGLLDEDEDGRLQIHGWHNRQFRSDVDPTSTDRKRRQRDRDRDNSTVTRDVTRDISARHAAVTRTDTDTDTEEIQKKKQTRGEDSVARPVSPAPKRADARHPLPSVDDLITQLRPWAIKKGITDILADEVERFHLHCLTKIDPETGRQPGKRDPMYLNYAAACQKWITNPAYDHTPRSKAPVPLRTSNEAAKWDTSISALQGVGGNRGTAHVSDQHGEDGGRFLRRVERG